VDNRGVIWARVSTEEQKGGYSLAAQVRLLEKFAKDKGLEVPDENIFKVAESASTATKRKEFKAMLAFIQKEHIPFLVAEKTDRIVRNLSDPAALNDLMNKGLTVYLVRESLDMDKDSPPHVGLTFAIMCAVASYIAKLIGREARKGMEEKAQQGGLPFKCPIGYKPVPDPTDPKGKKRTVIIDPERAPLVKWAFQEYSKGKHTLDTMAAELNRKGLTTRPAPPKTPARPISTSTLSKMFDNHFYHGEVHWSGGVYEGKHEPLITRQLFDQVRGRLAEKNRYSKPGAKKYFPFKPFLKCGYCGKSITAEDKVDGRYTYYHCSDGHLVKDPDWYLRKFGQKRCIQRRYTQEEIEGLIGEALGDITINKAMAGEMRKRLKSSHVEHSSTEVREVSRLQAEQSRQTKRINVMQDRLFDGTITNDEYKNRKAEAVAMIASLQLEIDRLRQVNLDYKEQGAQVIELMAGFKKVYEAADLDGKVRILNVVLDKVILKGDETWFNWNPPFDQLFFINQEGKGE